jgi:chemotaxis protein methyltransferase CheR
MKTGHCSAFLQRVLPRLGLRWAGFRRVRGLVCKRISRRVRELGLSDFEAYEQYLARETQEWGTLDAMCRIPISRFYRDRAVFAALEHSVLPTLAARALAEERDLRCWSACCASGEEAYTLALLWRSRIGPSFPEVSLRIVATDADPEVLRRARIGCYTASSLKELPAALREDEFEARAGVHCIRDALRTIEFLQQDIRVREPDGLFDVILCRNSVLTYFAPDEQRKVMQRLTARLRPGGALVIGVHERLPSSRMDLVPWSGAHAIFRATYASALAPPLRCIAHHPNRACGVLPPITDT